MVNRGISFNALSLARGRQATRLRDNHPRPRRSPLSPSRRGMALMDVLVAGLVLSGALVAVLGIASRSLSAQVRGQQIEQAAMVLDSLLNDVLALGPAKYLKSGEMGGTVDPPFDEYTYRISIDDISPDQPFRVTARVWWETAGGEQTIEVQALMAKRLGDEPDPEREPTQPVERP